MSTQKKRHTKIQDFCQRYKNREENEKRFLSFPNSREKKKPPINPKCIKKKKWPKPEIPSLKIGSEFPRAVIEQV